MVFSKLKKMSKWGVAASVTVALLGAGSAAYAGFSVGSIGSAKGLKATPSTDVFGNSLDNLILGQLSTEDLDSAGIDYSACGSSPLPSYILDYLETVLSQDAEDTSNWQTDVDGISDCDANAGVWQIDQANSGSAAASTVTPAALDDAVEIDGFTNSLLAADSTKSISDVQALFPSGLSSVTAASIKTMLAETVLGFDNSAQAEAYHNNTDKANFTVATFKACYNSASTYTPQANKCTISKNSWDSITGVQNVADNSSNQLTADLINGGLALKSSTINSAINTSSAIHLRYLEDCINDESDAITALSTCNTGFTVAKASLFYVAQIAAGASGYPTSALTIALLQDAGMTTGAHTNVGATLTQLKSNITTSSITTSSTGTNIDDWVTKSAGFNSGTTYSTVTTATSNGWTLANYKNAEDYSGWTNSSAHKTLYADCVADMTTCNYSLNTWNTSLKVVPTWTATSYSFLQGAAFSKDVTSKIGSKPNGVTFSNVSTGYSVSSADVVTGTLPTTGTSKSITFRIANASNSNKYVDATISVTLLANTVSDSRCYTSGSNGTESKCQSTCGTLGAGWTCMRETSTSHTTHPISGSTCGGGVNGSTRWILWDNGDPNDGNYRVDQFYGYNDTWDGLVGNCTDGPGFQNSCGAGNTFVCAKYTH